MIHSTKWQCSFGEIIQSLSFRTNCNLWGRECCSSANRGKNQEASSIPQQCHVCWGQPQLHQLPCNSEGIYISYFSQIAYNVGLTSHEFITLQYIEFTVLLHIMQVKCIGSSKNE